MSGRLVLPGIRDVYTVDSTGWYTGGLRELISLARLVTML